MKARVATVLSLTGVLVAGSAAALVNTQVLRSAAPASNTVVQLVDEVSSSSSDGVSTSAEVITSASVTTVAAPAASLKAFKVGSSGTVVLDTAGDVLRIDSTTPADGWEVVALDQVDALNVLITFQQGDALVDFRANLLFDSITPSVAVRSATTQGTANTTSGSGTTNTSTHNSTGTSIDDDDDSPNTTDDDSGKGGGGHDDDDSSSDDD